MSSKVASTSASTKTVKASTAAVKSLPAVSAVPVSVPAPAPAPAPAPVAAPTPAPAPAPAPAPVAAPSASTPAAEPKKSAKRKPAAPLEEAAAPAAEPAATTASSASSAAAPLAESVEVNTEELSENYLSHLNALEEHLKGSYAQNMKLIKDLRNEFKTFVKEKSREVVRRLKDARVAKRRRTQPQQSGITRPRRISAQLSNFLAVPVDSQLSLTDVSGRVCRYIKEHNLQNPADRRQIFCDDSLKTLLKPENGVISYPILQRLLTQHLIKEEVQA